MKAASLKDIKTSIETIPYIELQSLCIRLLKFKKENKELITYILFEENNEELYIESVKNETIKYAALNNALTNPS